MEANMNDYMDLCMIEVGPWLVRNGMDPMNVPDMMDSFEYVSDSKFVLEYCNLS